MSEISEQAKLKACEIANKALEPVAGAKLFVASEVDWGSSLVLLSLAHTLQQANNAARAVLSGLGEPKSYHEAHLAAFILSDPVDPLEAVCSDLFDNGHKFYALKLKGILAKRGLKIVQSDA